MGILCERCRTVMIGRPAPLSTEEYELGIMIANATEEMDRAD